ncbi:hypothetical protein ACIBEJ_51360 [Nonomuraea sp. NPDC050790]|uniref:hypothetical protein n=1 Tax=Nonomuraea sp. NPDC050790 TaxID=3364371 RepID=UPI003796375B
MGGRPPWAAPAVPAAVDGGGQEHAEPHPGPDPEPVTDAEQVRQALLHIGHPILCAQQEAGPDGLARQHLEQIEVFQPATQGVLVGRGSAPLFGRMSLVVTGP